MTEGFDGGDGRCWGVDPAVEVVVVLTVGECTCDDGVGNGRLLLFAGGAGAGREMLVSGGRGRGPTL